MNQVQWAKWQVDTTASIEDMQAASKNILEGCEILMQTDTQLSIRLDALEGRIDIVNKRIRRLEEAIARLLPR